MTGQSPTNSSQQLSMIDLGYMNLEPYLSDIGDSGSDSCSSEIRNILTDFDSDYVSLGEDNSLMPMLYTQ